MKIPKKVISLIPVLFLTSLSSPIFSLEDERINLQPNTLISNAIEEKEIKTVTSNGFGTTLESAAQNAAENALTQVVGSFIDAETQIKKQKEIRDGVISKTKIIKKDVRDYSQGSIKYFEILNIQQNGSIFNVTARVDVRIDDFKAYIKELAKIETQIDNNLFSIVSTEKSNEKNKFELYKKTLSTIKTGEVLEIKQVGKQEILEDITAFGCRWNEYIRCWENVPGSNVLVDNYSRRGTIVIPYSITIKKEFLENAKNILDNISDGKVTLDIPKTEYKRPRPNFKINSGDYLAVVINSQFKTRDFYLLKEISNQNSQFLREINYKNFPKMKVSFLDKQNQKICMDFVDINVYKSDSKVSFKCLTSKIKVGYIRPTGSRALSYNSGQMIQSYDMVTPSSVIFDKVNFLLIIEPSEEFIQKIQNINLEIIQ